MKPILIVYATREGQTRHIAEYLSNKLKEQQLSSDMADVAHIPKEFSLAGYRTAIVCASVHIGKHEPEMVKFVKRHLAELQQMPTAFVSVSLAEAGAENQSASPEDRAKARADVERTIEKFLAETGWRPSLTKPVAGALAYSKYNFVVRYMMKRIAKQTGSPTDTSRDHEFTDWAELDRLVRELAESCQIQK